MSVLGNLSGDVRNWRANFFRFEIEVQSDGAYSGGDTRQGGTGGSWESLGVFSTYGEFLDAIAELHEERPKPGYIPGWVLHDLTEAK